jgi:hypothetical protein
VIVAQKGPFYLPPLTVETVVAGSLVRRTLWVRDASTEFAFVGAASSVKIDPDRRLLLTGAF